MTSRIGILGGTFDPIHFGHLAIAEEARVALRLDRVLLIPAGRQPLKPNQPAAGAEHRLAMVRLACAGNPAFVASDIEIRRPGPSYTVTTLEALHAAGEDELHFIIGADALADFSRWYAAQRILALAQIVVVLRPGVELEIDRLEAGVPGIRARLALLEGPNMDLSSSEIRRRLSTGRPIRYLTPDAVVRYIDEHRLYRAND